MKTAKEIMQEIDTLCDAERKKLLYEITKKNSVQGFPVGRELQLLV